MTTAAAFARPRVRSPRNDDAATVRRALLTIRVLSGLDKVDQEEWVRRHLRRARAHGMPLGPATLGEVLAWSSASEAVLSALSWAAAGEDTAPAGTGAAPSDPAAHDGHGAARERSPRGVGANSVRRL